MCTELTSASNYKDVACETVARAYYTTMLLAGDACRQATVVP